MSVVRKDGTSYCIGATVLAVGRDVAVNPGRGGRTNDVNSWLATLITDEYRHQFKESTWEEKRAMICSIYQLVLDKGGNFWGPDGQVAPKDVAVKYIRKMIVGAATKKSTSLPNLTPTSSFFEDEFSDEAIIRRGDEMEMADAVALVGEDYRSQNNHILEPNKLHDEIAGADPEVLNMDDGENSLQALCAMAVDDPDSGDMISWLALGEFIVPENNEAWSAIIDSLVLMQVDVMPRSLDP